MNQETFLKLRSQIVELFPTIEGEYFYTPRQKDSQKKVVISARGYCTLRCILRIDANREKFSNNEVISSWGASYQDRCDLLSPKDNRRKKPVTIEQYLKSFVCLSPPFGISLVSNKYFRTIWLDT